MIIYDNYDSLIPNLLKSKKKKLIYNLKKFNILKNLN